jgi:hypothetical protein
MMNLTGVTALPPLASASAALLPASSPLGSGAAAGSSSLLADLQANLGTTSSSVNSLGDAASSFQVTLPTYKPMPAIDANATHDTAPTVDDPDSTSDDPSVIQEKTPGQTTAVA